MRPHIAVLDPSLPGRIVDEAMEVLATTGVHVDDSKALGRLAAAGAVADHGSQRVTFPRGIVEQALQTAPSSITLHTRDGTPHATLAGDRVHFVPGSSALRVLDRRTREARAPTTADFVEYVRLADGLRHIDYLSTAFIPKDVPQEIADAWRLYLVLAHSRKPVVSGAFTSDGVPRMAAIMERFRSGRRELLEKPMAIFTCCPNTPLRWGEDPLWNLMDCAEWGIPVEVVPVLLLGMISPVTTIGALVLHTAEVLSGLTIAQLARPGAPVIFGGAPAAFHMRETTAPMSAVEAMRLDLAYVAVAKHLGLPTQTYLGMSENRALDAQAGAESFGGALLAALAGVNSVSGAGMLDYTIAFSLPKLVLDNEMCGQALQVVRPFESLDDLPAIALAREQLAEGNMLTAAHTVAHYRDALYVPGPVWDRQSEDNWVKGGRTTLLDRAEAEVVARLAAYQPIETDPAIDRELRRLLLSGISLAGSALPVVPPPPARAPARGRGHQRRVG